MLSSLFPEKKRSYSNRSRTRFVGSLILALLAFAPCSNAWGVVGHEVVATIAQVYLHPSAQAKLLDILPLWTKGRLAPVASWPDRVRYLFPWSGELHYISPLDDYPPDECQFETFRTDRNVLTAISNYTNRFRVGFEDTDLRYLIHFVGDLHQPLHLMNRERGGNGDPALFEGRHFSLHGLWDTQMIARSLRELTNYTRPLPSKKIESALRGSIYDSYVRWILWEGLGQWWRDDVTAWLACAPTMSPEGQTVLQSSATYDPCPLEWAKPVHDITCSHVFPANYTPTEKPLRELGGKDYYGRIRGDKIIESSLAKAGIRLAATLNAVLADQPELANGLLFNWEPEVQAIAQSWQFKYLGSSGLYFL